MDELGLDEVRVAGPVCSALVSTGALLGALAQHAGVPVVEQLLEVVGIAGYPCHLAGVGHDLVRPQDVVGVCGPVGRDRKNRNAPSGASARASSRRELMPASRRVATTLSIQSSISSWVSVRRLELRVLQGRDWGWRRALRGTNQQPVHAKGPPARGSLHAETVKIATSTPSRDTNSTRHHGFPEATPGSKRPIVDASLFMTAVAKVGSRSAASMAMPAVSR